jgi:hypothetical protein
LLRPMRVCSAQRRARVLKSIHRIAVVSSDTVSQDTAVNGRHSVPSQRPGKQTRSNSTSQSSLPVDIDRKFFGQRPLNRSDS